MDKQKWMDRYRTNKSAIWIKVELSDGSQYFYDKFEGWQDLKSDCESRGVFVSDLRLQFRSHEVKMDLTDADGVYLIRSILGIVGGGEDKHFYVCGVLRDGIVYKKKWVIPELVLDSEYSDPIHKCFEEAFIHDPEKRTNRQEQV